MKKLYLLIILIFSFHFSIAQQENSASIEDIYNNYFQLDYETFYTQTNKKVFFNNEEIWFKTYIYNTKIQVPYISTTNVYMSIFNDSGKLIKKKVFHAKNGMTHGNFLIDDSFTAGNYILKTSTNWAKNFNENHNHYQQFKVIGNNISGELPEQELKYDFQLLPVQGYFLNNTLNTIGFKLINNIGESVVVKHGKVIDELNNVLTTFKSNEFGLGKFQLNIESNKEYTIHVELDNGEIITQKIENIKQEGIALNVNNSHTDFVNIKLVTNHATVEKINNQTYYLSIHRDGNLKTKKIELEKNKLQYEIVVSKKVLLPGINIITLFSSNKKPIAERIIFNNLNYPIKKLNLKEIVHQQDSSLVTIVSNTLNTDFSISTLPTNNASNNIKNNIISTFLLSPYIKGNIEKPNYYFDNINREKLYNLDLLLLTQGWSKFSWKNIFYNTPKEKYAFETGFKINGKLNNYSFKDGDELILLSKDNYIQLNKKLDESESFSFDKLYLGEKSEVKFSLKHRNGKLSKPITYYTVSPSFSNELLNTVDKPKFKIKNVEKKKNEDFITDTENLLDTVVLKNVTKTPDKKIENFVAGEFYSKRITFEDIKIKATPITDYIRRNGFEVINTGLSVRIISRRGGTNWSGPFSPRLFIDNIEYNVSQRVSTGIPDSSPTSKKKLSEVGQGAEKQTGTSDKNAPSNTGLLATLTLRDVEEITISHHGNLVASPGGVIYIFTKKENGKKQNHYRNKIIDFGYSEQKEYYSPLYKKQNDTFNKYGVINWIPSIQSDNNGEFTFKIPNSHKNVKLYIEGMSENGDLFSTIENISLSKF